MIPLFFPSYDGKQIQKEIKKLFPSNMKNRWLGEGPKTKEFEAAFGKKFGYKYCLSVNSCSGALELAYHILGLKEGDEIIYPVLTCTASGIPLLRMGVKIVFADIVYGSQMYDLTINPDDVEKKITKKTKAILAVTLGGLPIHPDIFKIGKKYKIPVIIDAAQSVGVAEKQGDIICYSFQAIKHFTTGDGGMLVLRNKEDYARAKKLRWFGIDREAKIKNDWQPYKKREMTMNIVEAGYKFHMNDIAATLGLVGLANSDKYLRHRIKIAQMYIDKIACDYIAGGAYWLFGIIVENRDIVAEKLKRAGIETNMAHIRNDVFTVFGGERLDLPNMNHVEDKYLYIPLNLMVKEKDARYVIRILNNILLDKAVL